MRLIPILALGMLAPHLAVSLLRSDRASPLQEPMSARRPPSVCTDAGHSTTTSFVPNVGQWRHRARYVHRGPAMTTFLEDRGWLLAFGTSRRGAAVRMRFAGAGRVAIAPGDEMPGHLDYFLGADPCRWRTGVRRFGSLRLDQIVAGIDIRLTQQDGQLGYDLRCTPDANLAQLLVEVEGATGLHVDANGDLCIDTSNGPIRQPRPVAWTGAGARRHEVACRFQPIGDVCFGFAVSGWNRADALVVQSGLLWSTFLGGRSSDQAWGVVTDRHGLVTVAGEADSTDFPSTTGAYDASRNGTRDAFVCCFDPSRDGAAQLVYATFIGGRSDDCARAIALGPDRSVAIAGTTRSADYPTSKGAFDTRHNGGADVFVTVLDRGRSGVAQLVYSSLLGGAADDIAHAIAVDGEGVLTIAGGTESANYPTTRSAFDSVFGGGDGIVSRLDPRRLGTAQLVYSSFLGGAASDAIHAMAVDVRGALILTGVTASRDFPTAGKVFDAAHHGGRDVFVAALDPARVGAAQLTYSTYLGGTADDVGYAVAVEPGGRITVAGKTASANFPTTPGALDTVNRDGGAFLARLDPTGSGGDQLVYSTFLGGSSFDEARDIAVDSHGVVTVTGQTASTDFPTTTGAFQHTLGGFTDAFVSRIDTCNRGVAQLVYSSYLGGSWPECALAIDVDPSGVATIGGFTMSPGYPTSGDASCTTFQGVRDAIVSRLDMGVSLHADVYEISVHTGGEQRLIVNAGPAYAGRSYVIAGSAVGSSPGFQLGGVDIPLTADSYMDYTIAAANTPRYDGFRGTLDGNGQARASVRVPATSKPIVPFQLNHAYAVFDSAGKIHMVSNPVSLRLTN